MRVKIYRVTPGCITDMMRVGWQRNLKVIENGIPEDAQLRNTFIEQSSGCIAFVIEHESFQEIADGALIPLADCPVFATWQ